MTTLLSLNELLESTNTHYTGDCHFVDIDNHQYSFIKGFLYRLPREFKNKFYSVKFDQPATYVIQEIHTGEMYIGSSRRVYKRVSLHKQFISTNAHPNTNFSKLLTKTNITNFELIVIFTTTREEAYEIEQLLVNRYKDSGKLINIAYDVRYAMRGATLSEEHKQKISKSNIGRMQSLNTRRYLTYIRKTSPLALAQMRKIHDNKRRRIMVNGTEYKSVTEAVVCSGISKTQIRKRILKKDPNIYWLDNNISPIARRPLSEEHRAALSVYRKTNQKAKEQLDGIRELLKRKIILDGVLYNSISDAVRITGFPECSIYKQLRGKKDQLVDGAYVLNFKKHVVNKVIIDGIVYDGVKQASEKLSINLSTLKSRIRSGTVKYYQDSPLYINRKMKNDSKYS